MLAVSVLLPVISSSLKKGPDVPHFRFLPVRAGTVTLSRRLLVVTAVDSRRLAKGSSGRSETEMSCLASLSSLPSLGLLFGCRPCFPHQLHIHIGQCNALTLLSLAGPPSEVMPLSIFLTMQGCSTDVMLRAGMGSHGAGSCMSLSFWVGAASAMAVVLLATSAVQSNLWLPVAASP